MSSTAYVYWRQAVTNGAFFMTTYVLLWVLVVAESVMLFVLLRQLGRVFLSQLPVSEREGVQVGRRLPDIPTGTPNGTRTLFSLVTTRSYTVVVLVSPGCPICREALEALREIMRELPWLGGAVLVDGAELDGYSHVGSWGDVALIAEKAARRLKTRVTPFAFVVGSQAQVMSKGVVNTTQDLHHLLEPAKEAMEANREALGAEGGN